MAILQYLYWIDTKIKTACSFFRIYFFFRSAFSEYQLLEIKIIFWSILSETSISNFDSHYFEEWLLRNFSDLGYWGKDKTRVSADSFIEEVNYPGCNATKSCQSIDQRYLRLHSLFHVLHYLQVDRISNENVPQISRLVGNGIGIILKQKPETYTKYIALCSVDC